MRVLALFCLMTILTTFAWSKESIKEDEKKDFERAQSLFKNGDEESALVSLSDFMRRHPQSLMADDVQYMIGMISFRKRNFKEAIFELQKTLNYRHSKGADHIADAALLIAESWFRLGEVEKAIIEWQALMRVFPQSSAAVQAELRVVEVRSVGSDKK